MKTKKIFLCLALSTMVFVPVSCGDDDLDSAYSIFKKDKLPAKNEFDIWLENNILNAYNIDIEYKFDFLSTSFTYQLSPVDFVKATQMAQIVKYGWLETYDEVVGIDFTRAYAPKLITMIGTPAYDGYTSTSVLASATQGLHVILYQINSLNVATADFLAKLGYFQIMHHEFSHILHQTEQFDLSFENITPNGYLADDWSNVTDSESRVAGFVTNYARTNINEDFAETYSIYITSTDSAWETIINQAGSSGAALINTKVNFLKDYMRDKWNLDMERMRDIIQYRGPKVKEMQFETFSQLPIE